MFMCTVYVIPAAFARRRHGYYHAQNLWATSETTLEYLQIAQLESQQKFSPDTLFAQCSPKYADVRESLEKKKTIGLNTVTHLISYKTMQNGRIGWSRLVMNVETSP
jgi:hypothetical protein